MNSDAILLGCGILKKEIRYLIHKNGWPLRTAFLDSTLHIDYGCLERSLSAAMVQYRDRQKIIFYGDCHPLMDRILGPAAPYRTRGQNCVEMLLGEETFALELERGAFFLLEDWALRWEEIVTATFGPNLEIAREIFSGDRGYMLSISTPCSGDFGKAASAAARLVGLPLRTAEAGLDNLERIIMETMGRMYGAGNPAAKDCGLPLDAGDDGR